MNLSHSQPISPIFLCSAGPKTAQPVDIKVLQTRVLSHLPGPSCRPHVPRKPHQLNSLQSFKSSDAGPLQTSSPDQMQVDQNSSAPQSFLKQEGYDPCSAGAPFGCEKNVSASCDSSCTLLSREPKGAATIASQSGGTDSTPSSQGESLQELPTMRDGSTCHTLPEDRVSLVKGCMVIPCGQGTLLEVVEVRTMCCTNTAIHGYMDLTLL